MTLEKEVSVLRAGNYFVCVKPSDRFEKDSLVMVLEVNEEYIVVFAPETGKEDVDRGVFENDFIYEPNGQQKRELEKDLLIKEASAVLGEITEINEKIENVSDAFELKNLPNAAATETERLRGAGVNDAVTEINAAEIEEVAVAGNENISANDSNQTMILPGANLVATMQQVGTSIADLRNTLLEKQKRLEDLKTRINLLLKEQSYLLEALFGFQDKVGKLQEAINMIVLYLGTGEQILQLKHGKFAPANEKLVIRQLILAMDEECALASDSGGIDAQSIELFDDWLLADARHLEQVLPEKKGIVALRARRNPKNPREYYASREDKKAHLLIRNGDNLFRVTPQFEVGARLFPSLKEFEEYFYEYDYIYDEKTNLHRREKAPVKPGSFRFNEAVEKMEEATRQYAKTLILLQGLVDRTGIFPELQAAGVNLIDLKENREFVTYLSDADPNLLLTNGRETFRQWQNRTNQNLRVGDRVIGNWKNIPYNSDRAQYERVSPRNETPPDNGEIYVLAKDERSGFRFYFERGQIYDYRNWEFKQAEKRASCVVYAKDDFMLAFDVITLEEVEYFLNDRLSRTDYLDMFPLLKIVRQLKRAEQEAEAPFIKLLVGEFMKIEADGDVATLEQKARSFVHWWKFKNRYARAISADDSKALRMIVKAYRTELKREGKIDSYFETLVDDKTLLVAEYSNRLYRVQRFDRHHIFVNLTKYELKNGELSPLSEKTEILIGNQWELWNVLYAHDDWQFWAKSKTDDFLTNAEYRQFLDRHESAVLRDQKKYFNNRLDTFRDEKFVGESGSVYLGKQVTGDQQIILYFYHFVRDTRLISPGVSRIIKLSLDWTRRKRKVELANYHTTTEKPEMIQRLVESFAEQSNWIPAKNRKYWTEFILSPGTKKEIEVLEKAFADYKEMLEKLTGIYHTGIDKLVAEINRGRVARAREEYLDSFGDPRNWENSRIFKKLPKVSRYTFKGDKYFIYLILGGYLELEKIESLTFSQLAQILSVKNLKQLGYDRHNCGYLNSLEEIVSQDELKEVEISDFKPFAQITNQEFFTEAHALVKRFMETGDFIINALPSFSDK